MVQDIILLVLGLAFLVGGANYLTDGAVSVARRFKVSNLMIGLTVVALGSAMPDIAVCVESALEGKTTIAVGEVVGSNIFDLLLVVGIMGLVRPWSVSKLMRKQDLPFLFIASFSLWIAGDSVLFDGYKDNIINRSAGVLLIVIFWFYMWFMIRTSKDDEKLTPASSATTASPTVAAPAVSSTDSSHGVASARSAKGEMIGAKKSEPAAAGIISKIESKYEALKSKQWFAWILIIGGLGVLVVGGNWVVDGATALALKAGMSQGMVALTVVAIGNSLSDLVTSLTATLKGASGIAFGNIVGACIINALLCIGLSASISPLNADTIGFVDFLTLAGASALIWIIAVSSKNKGIGRTAGAVLAGLYVAYMVFTIIRG